MKRTIVVALEWLCDHTHWATHHRPLAWFVPPCWLACKSSDLDVRWGVGEWKPLDQCKN